MKPGRFESQVTGTDFDLGQFYRSAPIALCAVDRDLRFIHVNDHMAEGNAVTVEEHIGRTVREILPALADTIEPIYRQVFETGEAVMDQEVRGATPAAPENERCFIARFEPVHEFETRKRREAIPVNAGPGTVEAVDDSPIPDGG